jgi:hypothetical protein
MRGLASWWFASESALPLVWVRVGVGLGVVRALLSTWTSGAAVLVWYGAEDGGWSADPAAGWSWIGGAHATAVDFMLGWTVFGALGVALGVGGPWFGRVWTFAVLQGFLAIVHLRGSLGGSSDELLANGLWLLVLADGTRTGSVYARWHAGRWSPPATAPRWARWMFLWQLVLMYTTTGWQKISAHWVPWGPADALWLILQQPTWQHADTAWLAPYAGWLRLGTRVAWLWEVSAPVVCVWAVGDAAGVRSSRQWLRAWAAVGVAFHLGVAALLDIGAFSWASLALYPALFAVAPRGSESRSAIKNASSND